MYPFVGYAIFLGPLVLLAATGIVLAYRCRTVATAIVALGFCAELISTVVAYFFIAEISAVNRAGADVSIVTVRWEGWKWLTHYAGLGGTWIGAIGLLWHAFQIKPRLSREKQLAAKID